MPRYSGPSPEEIKEIIAEAHGQSIINANFDPEYHEQQAAQYLASDLASEFGLIKASAHASLATSLRLKALMNGET